MTITANHLLARTYLDRIHEEPLDFFQAMDGEEQPKRDLEVAEEERCEAVNSAADAKLKWGMGIGAVVGAVAGVAIALFEGMSQGLVGVAALGGLSGIGCLLPVCTAVAGITVGIIVAVIRSKREKVPTDDTRCQSRCEALLEKIDRIETRIREAPAEEERLQLNRVRDFFVLTLTSTPQGRTLRERPPVGDP